MFLDDDDRPAPRARSSCSSRALRADPERVAAHGDARRDRRRRDAPSRSCAARPPPGGRSCAPQRGGRRAATSACWRPGEPSPTSTRLATSCSSTPSGQVLHATGAAWPRSAGSTRPLARRPRTTTCGCGCRRAGRIAVRAARSSSTTARPSARSRRTRRRPAARISTPASRRSPTVAAAGGDARLVRDLHRHHEWHRAADRLDYVGSALRDRDLGLPGARLVRAGPVGRSRRSLAAATVAVAVRPSGCAPTAGGGGPSDRPDARRGALCRRRSSASTSPTRWPTSPASSGYVFALRPRAASAASPSASVRVPVEGDRVPGPIAIADAIDAELGDGPGSGARCSRRWSGRPTGRGLDLERRSRRIARRSRCDPPTPRP